MKKKKIIKLLIIPILISGLILAYITSKKYTRDIYFQTPEDAINYIISNVNYDGKVESFKDALTERNYYSKAMFNPYWYSLMNEYKNNDNKFKELKDNVFIHNNHSNNEILEAIKILGDKQYQIYYVEGEEYTSGFGELQNEIKSRQETLILMVKDGPGWVLDTIANGSYVLNS